MLLLPEDLAEALATYLAQKPYKETYLLMGALSQLKEMPKVTADTEDDG